MKWLTRPALVAIAIIGIAGSTAGVAQADPPPGVPRHKAARVCTEVPAHFARCHALVRVDDGGITPQLTAGPAGFGPSDIHGAYNLASASGNGRTVAVVDAYDDPTAAADLATYRSQFGLAPCTTASGCFTKVGQTGSSTALPQVDAGWAQEISLDLDMVSATCPDCKILLVEAKSASFADLGTAVNYAASVAGVVAISNSYGGNDSAAKPAYNHPGIAITASTGDSGYGVESPASFGTVTAVGGTSLVKNASARGWSESAWSSAGSGCSTINAKPAWQTAATRCSGKANADVSAIADPNTGVAVYDSTPSQGSAGWMVFGGTSASAPIIAAVYALSGNTAGVPASYTWAHAANLYDVTSGTNGNCTTAVWCTSGAGWDGPTGLGTPNGTGAF